MYWFETEPIEDICPSCGGNKISRLVRVNDEVEDGITDLNKRMCHICGESWDVL